MKMISIDRAAGKDALDQVVTQGRERLKQGYYVIIFPEGTRRRPGASPDYKTGVSFLYDSMKVPCLPVAVNSGLFWARQSFLRRPGTVVISVLPPLPMGLPRKQVLPELQRRIETESDLLLENADPAYANIRNEA